MRLKLALFALIVLFGVLGSTAVYRHFQSDPNQALVIQNLAKVELSQADQKLIEIRDSTSKWLLGLSFALLPGLVVAPKSNGQMTVQSKLLPLLAGAMLIISLYGFFLAQDSVAFVLSRGPHYHLYGWVSNFPLLLQFWSLLAALILLMVHWLKSERSIVFPTLMVVAAVVIPSTDAEATPIVADVVTPCVMAWTVDRQVPLDAGQVARASKLIVNIARRGELAPVIPCEFAYAHLDQIRWAAFQTSNVSTAAAVNEMVQKLDMDLKRKGSPPGEFLERLLTLGSFYRNPSGLIRVEGTPAGATVLIDGKALGLTNLDLRLTPGSYLVEVLVDGAVVFRKSDVTIEDGKLWKATFAR